MIALRRKALLTALAGSSRVVRGRVRGLARHPARRLGDAKCQVKANQGPFDGNPRTRLARAQWGCFSHYGTWMCRFQGRPTRDQRSCPRTKVHAVEEENIFARLFVGIYDVQKGGPLRRGSHPLAWKDSAPRPTKGIVWEGFICVC
jgi:hypothetical protein